MVSPLVVLITMIFMAILDISVVNVAIPTIQNEFGATVSDVQWVITGYALAEGMVVPVSCMVGGSLWVESGLYPGAAGLLRWVGVVWARVEARHLGDLQNRPGNPRRNPVGR
jgi:MFS family permease